MDAHYNTLPVMLMAESSLARRPECWICPDPSVASLLVRTAKAVMSGDRTDKLRLEAKILITKSITSRLDQPENLTDKIFGIERVVSRQPMAIEAGNAVLAVLDVAECISDDLDAAMQDHLSKVLSHLAHFAAGANYFAEISPSENEVSFTTHTSNHQALKITHQTYFFHRLLERIPFSQYLWKRWAAVHRLYFILTQFIATAIFAAKRMASRPEVGAEVLSIASELLEDSARLFAIATPRGWQYRVFVRPIMMRLAPTISGADASDHGALMAALGEPYPSHADHPAFAAACQAFRASLSLAYREHSHVCRRAVGKYRKSLRSKTGQIPGWQALLRLRAARVNQIGRSGQCPFTKFREKFSTKV